MNKEAVLFFLHNLPTNEQIKIYFMSNTDEKDAETIVLGNNINYDVMGETLFIENKFTEQTRLINLNAIAKMETLTRYQRQTRKLNYGGAIE